METMTATTAVGFVLRPRLLAPTDDVTTGGVRPLAGGVLAPAPPGPQLMV